MGHVLSADAERVHGLTFSRCIVCTYSYSITMSAVPATTRMQTVATACVLAVAGPWTLSTPVSSLQPEPGGGAWWRGFTATLDTGLRTSLRYEVGLRPSPPGIGSLVVAPEVTPTVILGDTWELLLG